jgi:predicted phage terminase large subunit-like protein
VSRDALEAELLALKELELADRQRAKVKRFETKIRERCKSLYGFIEEFWSVVEPGTPFVGGWAIKAICDHLEAVSRGEIQNLLINVPPGMMKSLTVSVFWPAWEWGPLGRPDLRYLTTSYSEDNVLRDSRKTKKIIESAQYQALWGEGDSREHYVKRGSKWGEFLFENTQGGVRDCRPFASLTGGRGDRFICDDPHSTSSAESPAQRAKTVKDYREGASDRLNDLRRSATVVIMQRLHAQDVAGTILELDVGFVHLNLPMEFETEQTDKAGKVTGGACRTYIGGQLFFQDPRTEEGELLFPERFPAAEVARLKKLKGEYAWAGQYQQRPTPREGGLFKREWFVGKVVRQAPAGTIWVRHWDLAATKKETAARTAGVKLGKTPDGRYVVGHVVTTQDEGNAVRLLIRATAELDGKSVKISLPQDPGQAGKVQKQDYVAGLAGWVVRAEPETGDKVTRAEPFSVQCEAGNVLLVEGEWNTDYLDELCLFPAGKFKDQVDASSGAFGQLVKPQPQAALFGTYGTTT